MNSSSHVADSCQNRFGAKHLLQRAESHGHTWRIDAFDIIVLVFLLDDRARLVGVGVPEGLHAIGILHCLVSSRTRRRCLLVYIYRRWLGIWNAISVFIEDYCLKQIRLRR